MKESKDPPTTEPEGPGPTSPERRRFLARVSVGLGAGCGALAVPLVGFTLAPLLQKAPVVWRAVGKLHDFKIGETTNVSLVDASPLPWAGIDGQERGVAAAHGRERVRRLLGQLRAPRLPGPVGARCEALHVPLPRRRLLRGRHRRRGATAPRPVAVSGTRRGRRSAGARRPRSHWLIDELANLAGPRRALVR